MDKDIAIMYGQVIKLNLVVSSSYTGSVWINKDSTILDLVHWALKRAHYDWDLDRLELRDTVGNLIVVDATSIGEAGIEAGDELVINLKAGAGD